MIGRSENGMPAAPDHLIIPFSDHPINDDIRARR